MNKIKPIIVIVGPTASGKSELAVEIAKKYNGEIISADSRQIYKGMDIGSGKVEGKWTGPSLHKIFTYKKIPHHLIDEVNPIRQFSVSQFQRHAQKKIREIFGRGKQPIICGGTGHWVDAVLYNETFPEVKPNRTLRNRLAKLTPEQLFQELRLLDPRRAETIDSRNPRRLIRALEIIHATGKPVPLNPKTKSVPAVIIGLNPDFKELETKIGARLKQRIRQGMITETERLHEQGLSWKKLESFGLEYKFTAQYLQGKITKEEMQRLLYTAIRQYAKRQLTWFKRNKDIHWFADAKEAMKWFKSNLHK